MSKHRFLSATALQFALLLFVTVACQEPFGHEYVIENELQPYVEAFHAEAELRGLVLPKVNLIMMIKDDMEYRGLSLNRGGQRLVYIDRAYYELGLEYDKTRIEYVVFHELGHALLGRSHSNEDLSIMNTKRVDYSGGTREYFLDELFNR